MMKRTALYFYMSNQESGEVGMSKKSYKRNQNRLYREIKRRIIAEQAAKMPELEAKWIYGENETGVDGWHCSECNFFQPWFYEFTNDIDFIRFYGYYPSCGRKMTSYTGKGSLRTIRNCQVFVRNIVQNVGGE